MEIVLPTNSPDYGEILRLHRKYREREGEPLWSVFVRVGQKLEHAGRKERCPACGHSDIVYTRLVDPKCADPWHERNAP
jgi:hypothetical protein